MGGGHANVNDALAGLDLDSKPKVYDRASSFFDNLGDDKDSRPSRVSWGYVRVRARARVRLRS
jgi:hypothetical protein